MELTSPLHLLDVLFLLDKTTKKIVVLDYDNISFHFIDSFDLLKKNELVLENYHNTIFWRFETENNGNICYVLKNSKTTKSCKIVVSNIGQLTTAKEIGECFQHFGNLISCEIPLNIKKRYAIVEFDQPKVVNKIMSLSGKIIVNGSEVKVSRF